MENTKTKRPSCEHCGKALADGESHETVTRIVRLNNKFGDVPAGKPVPVCTRLLSDPQVLQATMGLDEYEAIESNRRQPKEPPKGMLQQMVEKAFEATRAQVQSSIASGKYLQERAREKAMAQGADLPVSSRPVDTEPDHAPTLPVVPHG